MLKKMPRVVIPSNAPSSAADDASPTSAKRMTKEADLHRHGGPPSPSSPQRLIRRVWTAFLRSKASRQTAESVARALAHARYQGQFTRARQIRHARQALGAIEAAMKGIHNIRHRLNELRTIAERVQNTRDVHARSFWAKHYEDLRNEIDLAAMAASYQGLNLIDGGGLYMRLAAGLGARTAFTISHTNLTAGRKGLNLPALRFAFTHDTEVEDVLHAITLAEQHLDWAVNVYRQEAVFLRRRFAIDIDLALFEPPASTTADRRGTKQS